MRLRRVNAVEQGTGDALLVFGHDHRRAHLPWRAASGGAGFERVAVVAARTGMDAIEQFFHVRRRPNV